MRHATSCFNASVASASSASSDATANAAPRLVFVVQDLDVQRHRVGEAADVPRHHRHRAEFAHRARIAQDHAVEQSPADLRQHHAPEHRPAARAEGQRGLLLFGALRLHQRDQLARDERKRDEGRREHDAGHREDDLDVVRGEPAEPALRAEQQHEDQAGDHRRDRERQIDQTEQETPAAERETRDQPRRGDAEQRIRRHHDRADQQGQTDRGARIGIDEAGDVEPHTLLQPVAEYREQRQQQEQADERERDRQQSPAQPARIAQRGRGFAPALHRASADRRRTVHNCSRLIANSAANEASSSTSAIAVAPA